MALASTIALALARGPQRAGLIPYFRAFSLLAVFLAPLPAADFSFIASIRAGAANAGDYELLIGDNNTNPAQFRTATLPAAFYLANLTPEQFKVGYTQSTNTAYLTYFYNNGANSVTATYNPTGGAPIGAAGYWYLPASGFYDTAAANNLAAVQPAIKVESLAIAAGTIVNPLQNTGLTAVAPLAGSNAVTQEAATVRFYANASGDWSMTGTVAWTGLRQYVTNGSWHSQTAVYITANATNTIPLATPEPSSFAPVAAALALAGLRRKARARVRTRGFWRVQK